MIAVATPTDKRFRRAQVKPGRKRSVAARQWWLGVRMVAVVGLTIYGLWRGSALVLGAPALQVAQITVRGNERLSTGEILAVLDGLHGRNILTVDLKEWQDKALASPWVAQARMRRFLPSRIDLELQERHPIGIGRLNGSPYLIDANGVVIDEYGPNYADLDLPMIDGLAPRPPRERGPGLGTVDRSRAQLAGRLIDALTEWPEIGQQVSQIDVSDAHDAVVLLDRDTALLHLGDSEFVKRIQEYLEVAPALRERVPQIDYVDLRFDGRLYVRPALARERK